MFRYLRKSLIVFQPTSILLLFARFMFSMADYALLLNKLEQSGLRTTQCTIQGSLHRPDDEILLKVLLVLGSINITLLCAILFTNLNILIDISSFSFFDRRLSHYGQRDLEKKQTMNSSIFLMCNVYCKWTTSWRSVIW